MVNILNVNPDIYINCNYQPFLFNFIKNKKLKIGDIIGVIKNHLQKSFIIGPGHTRIANKLFKHKFVITPEVIEHIKNPVIHFKPISYLIHHLEFNATHFCLRKVLDFNKYDNIKVIYKYSSVKKLTFINDDNILIDSKLTSIIKKDNLLIFMLDNLNKKYTTIETIINVPKDELNLFIKTKMKSLVLYWKLESYTQVEKDTNYELKIKMSLPYDDIDIFNRKFI
jgi:hypothetical protein